MVKRLIGGLVLLNLTSISLGLTSGEVDITDTGVLEQLKELRTFIDEKRDFSKESKQLKPVLVQYRSSASKIDGVVQCNMQFNTDALHLNICGTSIQEDGTPLTITINVVYEYTDYVGYTIKTAKLNATKNQPIFESIVDKNGNKRFIEGEGTPLTQEGFTSVYCAWSLSGTHLMLVVAGTINDETTLAFGTQIAQYSLPDWVKDKIVGVQGDLIEYKKADCIATDYSTKDLSLYLGKNTGGVTIVVNSAFVADANYSFRVQFDLLIDNSDED